MDKNSCYCVCFVIIENIKNGLISVNIKWIYIKVRDKCYRILNIILISDNLFINIRDIFKNEV